MKKENGDDWPSYGYFSYKGKYFRLHHGISNRQFADIPSIVVNSLVKTLDDIGQVSLNHADFKKKALEEIEKWNNAIPNELNIPKNLIRASLDKYYWGEISRSSTLGLKIKVDWVIFSQFLEQLSSKKKELWETFGYIYVCRNFLIQRSIKEGKQNFENKMERYVKNIKNKSGAYINQIVDSIDIIEKTTNNAISEIYSTVTRESKKSKKDPAYTLYNLTYLNELRLKCNTLRSLTQIGDFPACFSEMRRIIEGLTTHMFWDQLTLKILKIDRRAKDMDLMAIFKEGSFKEAKEHNLNIKEVSNKKQILDNEALKHILNENSITTDKAKIFIKKLHENMSIASYAIIYGKFLSTSTLSKYNEKRKKQSKLMIIDFNKERDLLEIGSKEIIAALTESGIVDKQSSMNIYDRLCTALKGQEIILTPPPPTLPLRILGHSMLLEKTISELKDMYNEFSPFTHSTWESNTVWPFTSVLEIMTFAEILKRFTESLNNTINDFINFFKPMVNVFLI
ncbi:MAG: hypothetical protein M1166_01365 [Candidatus Thermoplasmatota archaeon]|jgi:hypothetical protein|nr:hypothetical protein [Candidatus Thermoplasmatota archaeon]